MASLASCRAVAHRPALASTAQQRGRRQRVAAQYTPEQVAFLDRKARESRSPAPAQEARGRSPVTRRPTASPAAAKWDHATRVMPAGAAPPTTPAGFDAKLAQDASAASGLSAEQEAFMQRKAAEQASTGSSSGAANPVPYSQRKPIAQPGLVGSLAKQPPSSPSPRPSFRPTSRQPAPAAAKWDHATRVMPAGAAPPTTPAGFNADLAQNGAAASGLSAEQAAFVQRKAAEVRAPPPPTPLRGRSAAPRPSTASPAAAKWDHATRVMPAGASAPVTPAGFDANLAQNGAAASGLSAEQAAFVQRKAAEQASAGSSSGAANPVPYAQRKPVAQPSLFGSLAKQPPSSASPRPSFRPTSRQPAPAADEQASAGSGSGAANPVPYAQRKPIAQPGLVGSLAKQPPSAAPSSLPPRPSFRPTPRQASPAAAKWDHATRVMPAGSPPPVTPARYVHVTPEEAAMLTKEQAEFLERKRAGEK